MLTKQLLLLFFLSFAGFVCTGQGENNNWFFGQNVGFSFNSGSPALVPNPMSVLEGSATVSAPNGSLLFFSNGNQVWDRNGNVMPNGSGLLGNQTGWLGGPVGSASQGVAVVQHPADTSLYFLFVQDAGEAGPPGYLRYSVVDLSLNNGLGDIAPGQKNIVLQDSMTESAIVIKGEGCYNWLLVHNRFGPEFMAYKIDANGLDTTPVRSVSGVGTVYLGSGCTKVSPDRTKLFSMIQTYIEYNEFDPATGVVSNGQMLDTSNSLFLYSCGISPDGSKLYVGGFWGPGCWQYNLNFLPDMPDVAASKVVLSSTQAYSDFRLGPDQKLYASRSDAHYIAAIQNPNLAGWNCMLLGNAIYTGQNVFPYIGLGNTFVANYIDTTGVTLDTSICFLQNYTLHAPAGFSSYLWSDNSTAATKVLTSADTVWVIAIDGCRVRIDTFKIQAVPQVTSLFNHDTTVCFLSPVTLSAPPGFGSYLWDNGAPSATQSFNAPATAWVQSQNGCDIRIDTFHLFATPVNLSVQSSDTTVCFPATVNLQAPAGYVAYLWNDGNTSASHSFSMPGTVWVQSITGCDKRVDTFHVLSAPTLITTHVWDTSVCFPASVALTAPPGYNSYLWSDNSTAVTNSFGTPGLVWLTSFGNCSERIDSFHIDPLINLTSQATDTDLCFADSVFLLAQGGFSSYLWSNGTTVQTASIPSAGTYWVTATSGCNVLADTFHINATPIDTTHSRTDTVVCFQPQLTLTAPPGYTNYLWNDGDTSSANTIMQTSVAWVSSRSGCDVQLDSFGVQLINFDVDLGADTALCAGDILRLDISAPGRTYIWQNNSMAPVFNIAGEGTYWVTVGENGCFKTDTLHISSKMLTLDLGPDTTLCIGQQMVLNARVPGAVTRWQNGSTWDQYEVDRAGIYWAEITESACKASDTVVVQYEDCNCKPFLPSAFTPNDDGKNDYFGVHINCTAPWMHLVVANRWGNIVFETESFSDHWDGSYKGTPAPAGTYNYYLRIGTPDSRVLWYRGTVTLLR